VLFLPLAFESPIPEVINTSSPEKTGGISGRWPAYSGDAPADSFLSWYFRDTSAAWWWIGRMSMRLSRHWFG
jgi:hypothetical protein